MKENALTTKQIQELRQAHRSCKDKQYAYRINAIILLGSGWSCVEVANALLLDEETIRGYSKRYFSGGVPELLTDGRGGSECKLTLEQMSALEIELDRIIYMTTQSVIEYVKKAFKVSYTSSGLRDLLHRMGYEHKKPKLVPGHPDLEAQEQFAKEYYEYLEHKPDDVELLFADGVHPEHNTMAAYGWIKRGETRELKTNSGRQRLNLHGALNAETYKVTIIESDTINHESTLKLLEAIEQAYPLAREILLIVDNARYHFSKQVSAYLENSRIRLIPLPSYSPNLNLIERLWKFFKKKVLYNQYYGNLKAFRKACIKFFSKIDDVRDEMISFIGHEFELA